MRIRSLRVVVAVAAVLHLSAPSLCAQVTLAERIDAYVRGAHADGDFHGSISIANHGAVIYENSMGFANYQWDVPNTIDTKFRIGSITKQFTGLLVMQQVEEGTLALDDTISDHLSYYRSDTADRVTISQLLNHTSGIPDWTAEFVEKYERNTYGVREFIELFCSGDLEFAPGEDYAYSNSGYYILGAILEEATGRSYGYLIR